MTSDQQVDRARLRALAEKATPGPWIRYGVRQRLGDEDCLRVGPDGYAIAFLPIGSNMRTHAESMRDAAYIAAASPDVLLRLLDALDALRHENHNLNWALGTDGYEQMYTEVERAEHAEGMALAMDHIERLAARRGGQGCRRPPPAEAVTGAMVAVARDAHRAAMLATNGDRVAAMRAAITAALAAKEQP